MEVAQILYASVTQSPVPILVLIVFTILMWRWGRIRAALEATSKKIIKPRADQFRFTLQALVLSLFLVILALLGFLYTTGSLFGSLVHTLWLVLGFFVIHQFAVRWLFMTRRKLAFEAALERRRATLAAEQEEKKETNSKSEESELQVEEPEIDLFALNQESRKLVNAAVGFSTIIGLWFIWSDLLPAFGFLEQVSLWHRSSAVGGETQLVPVTLADLLLALLVVVITIATPQRDLHLDTTKPLSLRIFKHK